MLLDLRDLIKKYDLSISGICHLGGHLAEEAAIYRELGISNVVWIEANADNIKPIARTAGRLGHHVIEALVTDVVGEERTFNITNYQSMSSSVFEFGTHSQFSPDTVFVEKRVLKTETLDHLMELNPEWFEGLNMLVMDIQGAELLALRGASKLLEQVDIVMSEVNTKEVYVGCAKLPELDKLLGDLGFKRVETCMVPGQGWGDGIWIRK